MSNIDFTFSDLIAGYVQDVDQTLGVVNLKTPDDRVFSVRITDTTFAKLVQNLGEDYQDRTGQLAEMLTPGRFLFVYGVFYPDGQQGGHQFEGKELVFLGDKVDEYRFEEPDWWVNQVSQLADFYLRSEFGQGEIDYQNYRTELSLSGDKTTDGRQETDTISRLVYGFATAYLMTGEDRFLSAAEKGTKYLQENLSVYDKEKDICYWYHAMEIKADGSTAKVFASDFGDDYDAMPCYEQIYALAGPTQTYRINGDPAILSSIEGTINLFQNNYRDKSEQDGYFSHLDPVTLSPLTEDLGDNQAKKNWNSVGDHCPAYMVNAYLATNEASYAVFLKHELDLVAQHFPDFDNSPYVNERFYRDWSKDQEWKWQQNRAVMGHNYKIAWNLMRVHSLEPNESYQAFAQTICAHMAEAGLDPQRSGLYDVRERELSPGESVHRFTWHDRKAWWQQEQVILAYQIMYGLEKKEEYLKRARENAAFYNAWFLDTISGGVYFNVLANGKPYALGTERDKGSHSMAGYHAFELCYLATTYSNLLITEQPVSLFFKPQADGFKDNILRVAPDILPQGSIKLAAVWINDKAYFEFDSEQLAVQLPRGEQEIKVRVQVAPSSRVCTSELLKVQDKHAEVALIGELGAEQTGQLVSELQSLLAKHQLAGFDLRLEHLDELSDTAVRALLQLQQDQGTSFALRFFGAKDELAGKLQKFSIVNS